MLARTLHKLVARPAVYELAQTLVGARVLRARLAAAVAGVNLAAPGRRPLVVDVGGGTGTYRSIWPDDAGYVCVDLDPLKLRGLHNERRDAAGIQGDALRLPLADHCADAIACTLVSHHLPGDALSVAMSEIARVLRPDGVFIFADAVWQPARWVSRLLWRYDRGSSPRTDIALRHAIASRLTIERWEELSLWHHYVICVARKTAAR